jgi:hypothetical protein
VTSLNVRYLYLSPSLLSLQIFGGTILNSDVKIKSLDPEFKKNKCVASNRLIVDIDRI